MKTWKKIIFGIGLSVSLIGAGLTAYGFASGGAKELQKQSQTPKTHYKKVNLESFDRIDLTSHRYDVIIATANIDKPRLSYTTSKKPDLSYTVKDKTLTITDKGKRYTGHAKQTWKFYNLSDLFQQGRFGIASKNILTITLPKGTNIKSLKANIQTADLSLESVKIASSEVHISAGDLESQASQLTKSTIKLDAGDTYLNDSDLLDTTLETSTGDIDISTGAIVNSKINLSMGDFTGSDLTVTKRNHITVNTGDIDINLAKYDLTINQDSQLGDSDITSDLKPSSENFLTLNSSTGDITVQ